MVTIPASGSEASNSCVISNDAEGLKSGCNSELIRPKIAFLDPELTFTLPPYQTAAGVTDMIAHIMERFFSGEPAVGVTDNIACGLIRAAIDAARIVMNEPENYDARAELMWIGTLAHNGLAGCGLGIPGMRDGDWSCHGMEHEVSAVDPSITHGAGLAVVFPAWMRHVWYDARAELMWIGTLAHNGLAGCGLGIPGMRDGDWSCHGMEHEVSAVDPSITHGAGLAVVFPAWMRHVWKSHPERFLTFGAEVFGIEPRALSHLRRRGVRHRTHRPRGGRPVRHRRGDHARARCA